MKTLVAIIVGSFIGAWAPLAFGLSATKTPAKSTTTRKVVSLVERVQEKWDDTKRYQAKFEQTIRSKQLGTEDVSNGLVSVVKPTKLRWHSTTDGSIQILNGKKLILIEPNERRKIRNITIYEDASAQTNLKLIDFLSGKSKLKSHYTAKLVKDSADSAQIELTPKSGEGEKILASVDKKTYFLSGLITEDVENRIEVRFTEAKIDPELDDKLFEYKEISGDRLHSQ